LLDKLIILLFKSFKQKFTTRAQQLSIVQQFEASVFYTVVL